MAVHIHGILVSGLYRINGFPGNLGPTGISLVFDIHPIYPSMCCWCRLLEPGLHVCLFLCACMGACGWVGGWVGGRTRSRSLKDHLQCRCISFVWE